MEKPVLYPIPAFDAKMGNTISFSYSGEHIIKSEAVFYNSVTGAEIYGSNKFCNSPLTSYVLPANTLTNTHVAYYVKLRIYDELGGISEFSDARLFYCVTTPTFRFSGLNATSRNILEEASHIFSISYARAIGETEDLDSYNIFLYDEMKTVLQSSKSFYEPNINYEIDGLLNQKTYYVRAIGVTQNGMELDTGYVEIAISYDAPDTYTTLSLTNNREQGTVTVKSNIVSIDGLSYWYPSTLGDPIFVDGLNGRAIDLTGTKYLVFENNFRIPDSFDIEVVVRDVKQNGIFLSLCEDLQQKIRTDFYFVQRSIGSTQRTYVAMIGKWVDENSDSVGTHQKRRYTIQSNYINYTGGYLKISIKRSNRHWNVFIKEVSAEDSIAELSLDDSGDGDV